MASFTTHMFACNLRICANFNINPRVAINGMKKSIKDIKIWI